MREAFITKATQSATEEGNVPQKVEMVFKSICDPVLPARHRPEANPGALKPVNEFSWDIPAGKSGSRRPLPGATYKP